MTINQLDTNTRLQIPKNAFGPGDTHYIATLMHGKWRRPAQGDRLDSD